MIPMLLTLAILQSAAASPTEPEQPATQAATGSIKGADLDLLREVREIAGRVERLRGQQFDRPPVAVRAPDPMREVAAEIRAYKLHSPARLEARGRAWADLGFSSPASPANVLRHLAADLEGIGFDAEANRLLVTPDRLTKDDFAPRDEDDPNSTVLMMTGVRRDEPLFGHALLHVRQMEREGRDVLLGTTDGTLARAAWAEGEANLVAVRLLFEGMGLQDEVIAWTLDPRDVLDGLLVPSVLESLPDEEAALLRFVYLEGFSRAVAYHRMGGWAKLDAAMATQRTTSQILHPDRQLARDRHHPEPVPPAIDGIELIDVDSLGEQGIIVLVSAVTGKDNLGLLAGDGWVQDELYRWELPSAEGAGSGITLWLTRWSDEKAASDFEYALGRMFQARFPGGTLAQAAEGAKRIDADGRRFEVERAATEVRLRVTPLELLPAETQAEPAKTD